jgi:hypothetical protein
MKKKQVNRKLSLNKQTLSQLDAQALNAIKGGQAPTGTDDPKPTQPCYV